MCVYLSVCGYVHVRCLRSQKRKPGPLGLELQVSHQHLSQRYAIIQESFFSKACAVYQHTI